jgi:transposase InsO family protein
MNEPIEQLCAFMHVSRGAYYRWVKVPVSYHERHNQAIADEVRKIHEKHSDMGYRRIRDELDRRNGIKVNDKRVLNICRKVHVQSAIKWKPKSCTTGSKDPAYIAKNFLHREFHADAPNEKWLTDVSEFKYYTGIENTVHKIYLSAILDLYDRRIVTFMISNHNDNPLVMNTFDKAVELEPDAHPMFHSDRGFQYTSVQFCNRLKEHHMKQSMSRVAHCIDNGPMEGFWGILKREEYYGRKFTSREELTGIIDRYIKYYNNDRLQRGLHLMTPAEFHEQWRPAA